MYLCVGKGVFPLTSSLLQVVAISLAVLLFIVETMPNIKAELGNPDQVLATSFFVVETLCVAFFTVELVGAYCLLILHKTAL